MRHSTFIGLLVVLLKQCCASEGGSTPNQSSTEVTHQDGQTLHPELPAADMMPVVSLPSLKEVQQAVKTASEQVDSRGAGEVLKELLERVVEAALGHAQGGGVAKAAAAEKKAINGPGVETGQREAETLEQPVLDKNISFKEGDAGFDREGEAEADAFEDEVVGEKRVVKGEGGTAAESIEKSTESVETEVRQALEDIDESLGTKLSQEVTENASEEAKVELERREEDSKEQVVLSVLKNATETEIWDKEETPAAVEAVVDVQPEQETVNESPPGLGEADDEQIGNNGGREVILNEKTPTFEIDGAITVLPSKDSEIKITKPVVGGPAEVEEEVKRGTYTGREEAGENGDLVAAGSEDKAETERTYFREATADEINNKSVIKEESVASMNEGGDNKAGEEEQTTLKNLHHVDDQETLVIPGLQLEDSTKAFMENIPEHSFPTSNPSADEVESEENTLDDEKSDHSNEIITPTDDFLPHKHGRIHPTLDHFQNDVLAEYHQAEGGGPREAHELVKNLPRIRETDERGLEAWKIGAILAAVFLVLETLVIILYIVKCQNKKSTPPVQPVCEDGRVEPKAAAGGDCSDDTLPAGSENTQQTATAPTLARKREQRDDEHAVAMTNLSSCSKWEWAISGPEPDPSQDLRPPVKICLCSN